MEGQERKIEDYSTQEYAELSHDEKVKLKTAHMVSVLSDVTKIGADIIFWDPKPELSDEENSKEFSEMVRQFRNNDDHIRSDLQHLLNSVDTAIAAQIDYINDATPEERASFVKNVRKRSNAFRQLEDINTLLDALSGRSEITILELTDDGARIVDTIPKADEGTQQTH
jgi:hypothetical protein